MMEDLRIEIKEISCIGNPDGIDDFYTQKLRNLRDLKRLNETKLTISDSKSSLLKVQGNPKLLIFIRIQGTI